MRPQGSPEGASLLGITPSVINALRKGRSLHLNTIEKCSLKFKDKAYVKRKICWKIFLIDNEN